MDYTETKASRMLKKYNDILYETLRKAKGDVRDSFQQTLSTIIERYPRLKTGDIPNCLHLKEVMSVRFPASLNCVVLHRHF